MTIFCIQGGLGSGKNAGAVAIGYDDYYCVDRAVVANFDIDFMTFKIRSLSDFDRIPKGAGVFIDEIYMLAWSRKSSSVLNDLIIKIVSKSRKHEWDLFYIQQWDTGADRVIREVTDEIIRPSVDVRLGFDDRMPLYRDLYVLYVRTGIMRKWHLPTICEMYNTREVVDPLIHDESSLDRFIKKLKFDQTFLKLQTHSGRRRHIQRSYALPRDDADYLIDLLKNVYQVIS